MKAVWCILLLALCGPSAQADVGALARLAWLGGCWASDAGETGSGEIWMPLAGGTLLGISRTVKDGRTRAFEFMQIHAQGDGRVVFVAEPAGQARTTFVLGRHSDTEAVFENLRHDFPQRVIYRRSEGGRLGSRIEGLRDGTLRGMDFPMRRVRCEQLEGSR